MPPTVACLSYSTVRYVTTGQRVGRYAMSVLDRVGRYAIRQYRTLPRPTSGATIHCVSTGQRVGR
eukprot:775900-Rhodomonas_salina.2